MKKHILPILAMDKLLRKGGAKGVSYGACEKMRELLEEYALLLSKKAVKSAFFAGRKIVKREDFE